MSTTKTTAQVPKLRFPGFEGDWWTKPLQALSQKSITYGIVQTGEPVEGGIKCVRVIDLTKAKIDHLALITTTPEISRSYKRTILEEGEIMVALRGDIGLVALVPAELAGSNLTRGIARIAPKRSEVTPGFLLWSLRTDHAKTEFNKQVNGSALKEIPINGLNKVEAQLTTLAEQQKIAAFLTAVDGRIEQLSRKKALLEATKKGLMQQLFTQTLRFQDDHGHDFPDWEEKKLSDIASIFDGTHSTPEYTTTGVPFYSVEHVTSGQYTKTKFISEEVFKKENKRVSLERGDILMTRIGDIGTSVHIDWDVRASFYVSLALIKLRRDLADSEYVHQAIGSRDFQRELWHRTIHSAFPIKINLGEIGECKLKLPSLPEPTKIAGFLSARRGRSRRWESR